MKTLEKKVEEAKEDFADGISNALKDLATFSVLRYIMNSSPKVGDVEKENRKHLIARGYVRQEKGVLYATEKGIQKYRGWREIQEACRKMQTFSYEELHRPFTI